jgi:hypothetical protein
MDADLGGELAIVLDDELTEQAVEGRTNPVLSFAKR